VVGGEMKRILNPVYLEYLELPFYSNLTLVSSIEGVLNNL
jgi:hypothetical protein